MSNTKRHRRRKPVYYILNVIKDGQLISQKIEAQSLDEAMALFEKEYGVRAQVFHGPFAYRRDRSLGTKEIIFSNKSISAIYNNWKVKAILLQSPPDCVFLLFQERIDGKKVSRPQGTFIVKREDLNEKN